MTMKVERCDRPDPSWNRLVAESGGASVFHLYEWRTVIQRSYGHQAHYLMATDEGKPRGVLPLILIKSRLFGRALVSMPFCDYAGVCGSDTTEVFSALMDEAVRLGRELGADYLQIRQSPFTPHGVLATSGAHVSTNKVTMLLDLSRDPELMWKRLPAERRNRIKRARQSGVTVRWGGAEVLDAFYDVFVENMRDLGSPVHSRYFFEVAVEALGAHGRFVLVEYHGQVIGAAWCLGFRDTMLVPWVSSRRRFFKQNPNMLLYWGVIEYGCEHGFGVLDFGRSTKDSGTYEFKRQWGARPVPLPWFNTAFSGGAVPAFSDGGWREQMFIACWKRLPVGVTRHVGPWLRGAIPA